MEKVNYLEPFTMFEKWFGEAENAEPIYPNAVCVSSTTPDGFPSSRMVLMKGWDEDGFVFYTNFESRKGVEILANPNVALLFHWKSLNRQVRIEGVASQVSDAEADDYFQSRPRDSRIGAWASDQSRPMEGRFVFEKNIAKYTAKFGISDIPRPPHWSGFRVKPCAFEFWQDRKFRLHDRHIYKINDRNDYKSGWTKEIYFP